MSRFKIVLLTALLPLLLQGCKGKSPADPTATASSSPAAVTHVVAAFDRASGEEKFRLDVESLPFVFDGPGSVSDGRLFVVKETEESTVITAIDVATGKELWSKPVTGDDLRSRAKSAIFLLRNGLPAEFDPATGETAEASRVLPGDPLAVRDKAVICATPEELISFDTESWKANWKLKLAGVSHAAMTEQGALAVTNPNGCHGVSDTGEVSWNFDTPNQPSGLAASADAFFVGTAKPTLVALKADTGEKIWEKSWDGEGNDWARPFAAGDVVLFPAGKLRAFTASSGEKLWEVDGGRNTSLDSTSGQVILNTYPNEMLTCVTLADGKTLWSTAPGFKVVGAPGFNQELVFVYGAAEK